MWPTTVSATDHCQCPCEQSSRWLRGKEEGAHLSCAPSAGLGVTSTILAGGTKLPQTPASQSDSGPELLGPVAVPEVTIAVDCVVVA